MNLQRLGDRDGWICWVCENAVDPRAPVGSPNAGSMDHVVPRARGGRTEDDNLLLAHRRCNTRRGDRVPELQWPKSEDLIDSGSLWHALQRMEKKPQTAETVAFFSSAGSAEIACGWVVMVATRLTGLTWCAEVQTTGSAFGVSLSRADA